ncbi:hypothetical protein BpHYR1_027708 [Brachionus plicatilis]|uniref:Uncharacterized protein n=1 Tax=Brachionus plicatilis TaxID=10195 RepID=A0A3M7QIV1_BRAPC|nr:hypothetical protein BpHYR1_027708 [Brachionus plicatilis]
MPISADVPTGCPVNISSISPLFGPVLLVFLMTVEELSFLLKYVSRNLMNKNNINDSIRYFIIIIKLT